MRLFIAIKLNLDTNFVEFRNKVQKQLNSSKVKWVEIQNMHLTLKFIGEMQEFYVNSIVMLLRNVATQSTPFKVQISSCGTFGKEQNPSVVWVGIEKNKILNELQNLIGTELTELGIEKDRRNYSPHLTLGRIKHYDKRDNLNDLLDSYHQKSFGEHNVNEFHLYQGILTQAGPEYKILETFKLGEQ
ncbi:MAG: RNA 2',3'-cyclic phosphodiesterase [Bacteroidales bacterium]|nr:RNA 2',3'-cyclic phosphodiesterase [Bacteroidales bacterium]